MSQIVINGRFLSKSSTGVTRVGHELLRAIGELAQEDSRFSLKIIAAGDVDRSSFASLPRIEWRTGPATAIGEQTLLPAMAGSSPLLCFCNVFPMAARKPFLWLHDAQVLDTPQSYTPAYRAWHHLLFRAALIRNIPLITISQFSRARLIHHGASPERVHFIYNGGDHLRRLVPDDTIFTTTQLNNDRYVLIVGSRAPHKNIPFAVNALSAILDPDIKIAVAGLHQAGHYQFDEGIRQDPRIILLPKITDAALRALYRRASVTVVPSYFEGFGLPVAEAMWEGTPLALSNRAALPEVGGEAAFYFDPGSSQELGQAVIRAMSPEGSAILREAANSRKNLFSWRNAAKQTLDLVL